MILSDTDIKAKIASGEIVVESPDSGHIANINASSLDLRLGHFFKIYDHSKKAILDPLDKESFENVTKLVEVEAGEAFIVQPGEFVLGVTMEKIKIADNLVARVEGRSSLGRLGIIIHSTAGFIDAGFEGTITLEITNINRMPVALYPRMRVCQLAFEPMSSHAEVSYSKKKTSKYQGQILPQESRIAMDPEFLEIAKSRKHKNMNRNIPQKTTQTV
ncbi:dCTP deaminase [Candidatus Peregrinibacteria bacterium]|nr:dCTP deaminase [Candidatus Peregrinibacteria bacterium]